MKESIPLAIAKDVGDKANILNMGSVSDEARDISVWLWVAGNERYLLLNQARQFINYRKLPQGTSLAKAIELQNSTLDTFPRVAL
ncbi:hypothetical protein K0504_18110 [Neiella marina]|uniref:Uncharacterized protein n=1 Tax=Neiella holothuriorum TaxID=2870530 RepID=A0ABS7EL57_9GAMM|nr:hypothetical protein [Neiella holothuriorum]MBW8192950.1 hypothetical protein [Neiella holothuriorum]